MKNALLIISILLLTATIASSQKIVRKKNWKNEYGIPTNSDDNIKYIKLTIKEADGTKRYEIRETESNKLVSKESYNKNTPVGIWLTADGQELDYNFKVIYNKEQYTDVLRYDVYGNKPIGELKGKFEVPVFPEYRNNFRLYVAENLRYPVKALEKGIQGNVVSQFIIDENGKIVDLSIYQGAHEIIDKEAARAILESPEWTPAKLDGKPIKVYVVLRNTFFFKVGNDSQL